MSFLNKLKSLFLGVDSEEKDKVEQEEVDNTVVTINDDFKDNSVKRFRFEVKGTFIPERQKTIKHLVNKIKKEDEDFDYIQYEGFTNSEIKDFMGEKIYQYNESLYTGRLEYEPENKHDKNAIKVNIIDSDSTAHFIGYVPKGMTLEIKEYKDKYDYYVAPLLTGGKYKKSNYYDEKIETGEDDYKIEVSLSFWEELPKIMRAELEEVGIK